MHYEHPLRIIRYSIKNIWLLIFPLLRGVNSFLITPEAVVEWVRGTWFDLLILLCILGFGFLRWRLRRFTVMENDLYLEDGIFFRSRCYMPMERLSAMTLETPFWLAPFRGVYLYVNTAAGQSDDTDVRLLIRRQDAAMFERAVPKMRRSAQHSCRYRVHPLRIFGFSVIFSSSFYGSFYLAAFWFQGGRISRDLIEEFRLNERLTQASEELAHRLSGIPPAAVAVGIVVVCMWLLSLFANLMRYGAFYMRTDKKLVYIRSGLLMRRRHFLQTDRINYLDIRQNLLTKLFCLFALAVNCPGYGNTRGSIPVCLPLLTRRELEETLPLLFPGVRMQKNHLRPAWTALWGYIWLPVLMAAAILPAAWMARQLLPAWEEVIDFFRIMLLIPICWKLLVQILSLLTSGASMEDGCLCLRMCRGLVFHTILAGTERVVKVRIRRNPWHRIFGKCHVDFYLRSEVRRRYALRNVDYETACAMLEAYL